MRWSHVGLNCRDPRRTGEFYMRWFGFVPARAVPVDDGEVLFLKKGDAYLELFPAAGPTPHRANGTGTEIPGLVRHIAFQTDDVDAFLADMDGAAEITAGPVDFGEFIAGWRTVWIRDPDGVVVEVSQGYRDEENEDNHG
jgi:glyoxylase I family protein